MGQRPRKDEGSDMIVNGGLGVVVHEGLRMVVDGSG